MSTGDDTGDGTGDATDEVPTVDRETLSGASAAERRRLRILAFAVFPAVVALLAVAVGYLTWQEAARHAAAVAATESVAAARESAAAILTYRAQSVEADLNLARERLTGPFLESYTTLINQAVIPAAKEKKISAAADVVASGSVSATPAHAVVLVFVDQKTTAGDGPPAATASSIRVTLDKVDGRWLVSGFDPV